MIWLLIVVVAWVIAMYGVTRVLRAGRDDQ